IRLASYFSKKSRYYTSEKDYGDVDGLLEYATSKIKNGFDYVLFGHAHRREFRKIENGFYINLGSWIDRPCYGIFESEFKIIDL
ncbi:MAG: UDP-2,3-diacylglucosamine diphosphatase, partial [Ignavibacteria bacterium]|nr:UDP-2,3-diacylglucosamine diphosphatase [Ignavibacteria bacterium]